MPEAVLKLSTLVPQNAALHLRERASSGGQYFGTITIPAVAAIADIAIVDLLGAAVKTFTVHNRDAALALGAGSILYSGPTRDTATESKSTADFDSLAADAVASVSIADDMSRFWRIRVIGNVGGTIKLDIYVDVNVD